MKFAIYQPVVIDFLSLAGTVVSKTESIRHAPRYVVNFVREGVNVDLEFSESELSATTDN